MKKIRKGDGVVVLVGKDRGKQGTVLRCLSNGKLVVEGVNRVKKCTKPNPVKGIAGGILEKEMPINASNVSLFDSVTKSASRVGFIVKDGVKVRIFRSTQDVVNL